MRSIWLIGIAFFFVFLSFNGALYHVSSYYSAAGDEDTAFNILLISFGCFMLFSLISSRVVQIGLRRSMLLAIPCYAIFIASLGFGSPIVYLTAAIDGFGAAILWNAAISYVIKVSEPKDYGKNNGIIFTVLSAGSAIGVYVTGYILSKTGFILLGCIALAGIPFLMMIPEHLGSAKKIRLASVMRVPKAWASLAVFFGAFVALGLSVGILPIAIKENLGPNYAGITSIFFIAAILLSYLLGWLSDRFGRGIVLLASSFAVAIGLGMILIPSGLAVIAAVFLMSLVHAVILPLATPVVGDICTDKSRDSLSAMMLVVQNLGAVLTFSSLGFFTARTAILAGIAVVIVTAMISAAALARPSKI